MTTQTQITAETYDSTDRAIHWIGPPESRAANFDDLDSDYQEMFRRREMANILVEFGDVDWAQVQSVLDTITAQPETRQQFDEMLSKSLRSWQRGQRSAGICVTINGVSPATIDAARLAVLAASNA